MKMTLDLYCFPPRSIIQSNHEGEKKIRQVPIEEHPTKPLTSMQLCGSHQKQGESEKTVTNQEEPKET